MNVNVFLSEEFKRQFKRLSKRHPSLTQDFITFKKKLEKDPLQGEDLGHHVRKIRMAISSKGKGKSGGARVLTYNIFVNDAGDMKVTLLTIYDKKEISNVTDAFIKWLVSQI